MSRAEVEDEFSGVLCRCTGYHRIVDAVLAVAAGAPAPRNPQNAPAGQADGTTVYSAGSDADALGEELTGHRPVAVLKGVNIPIRLVSWATPAGDEATGVTWCGTR